MRTALKKYYALLLAAFLFAACLFPALSVAVFADQTGNDFDTTDVLDDLESMEGFSRQKYPHNVLADPEIRVIDFVEYCYDYRPNMRDHYALYLYIYNPTGKDIVTNSPKNKVEIGVMYDSDPITAESVVLGYEKFDLQFCSMSAGSGVERLFYKFKVIDHVSADGKTVAERVNSAERRYDLVGVELLTKGDRNATDYGIAASYHFSGYAEGYGDGGTGTTLSRNSLETVSLELYSTTYRFPYINQNGPGHQNQLDSVYFAVPKEYNENYGDLYRVKCCWDEQRTAPVIVTNDQEIYEDVAAHLGTDGSGGKYCIYDNFQQSTGLVGGSGSITADWVYNNGFPGTGTYAGLATSIPYVGYVFKSDKSNVKDTDLTSAQMKEWIKSHGNASYLFSDSVDEGRTKGYQEHTFTADEPFNMLTFNQTASGWDKFCLNWEAFWTGKSWEFGPEQQDPVDPIRLIKDGDFTGTDVTDAEKLYVHTEDFEEFENFYNANKSTKNVFLLRFAVTDYYSNLQVCTKSSGISAGMIFDDDSTYMARETVFLDFDIIELTFLRDTTETIIPVVASPIDVVGGISAPIEKDGIAWGKLILAVLIIILLLVLLAPILPQILSFLWWIISAPFKLIAEGVKRIRDTSDKNKKE